MKKIITFFAALAMLCAAMPVKAQTYVNGIAYELHPVTDSTGYAVVIANYDTPYKGNIVIPDSVTIEDVTYAVTTIGARAFEDCDSVISITLPNTIKAIMSSAFHDCHLLSSINLPEGLEEIRDDIFWSCWSLTELTLPSTLKQLYAYAFEDCPKLRTINFPESIEVVEGYLFINDTLSAPVYNSKYFAHFPPDYATSYSIPDGIETILSSAFQDALSLTSVTIPSSVKYIQHYAFYNTGLTSITLPEGVLEIGNGAFMETPITSLHLPASLTDIAPDAFPASLTTITVDAANDNYYVANNCLLKKGSGELVYVPDGATLPEGLLEIGDRAFMGRTFTSFTIPSTVTRIGIEAFSGCQYLDTIIIPEGVTSLGNNVFFDCTRLKKVTLPDGLKEIPNYAFYNCRHLEDINVPSSLKKIGNNAFQSCYELKSFDLPESVYEVQNEAFVGSGIQQPVYNSHYFAYLPQIYKGIYTMPDQIEVIAPYAFYYCDSLTEVIMPTTLRTIGLEAFWGCTSLTKLDIPASVDSILTYAFEACENVETIILRGSPSFYEDYVFAFYDNSKLKEVYNYAETPFEFTSQGEPFFYVPDKDQIKLYVPAASVDAYKAALYWQDFDVQPMPEVPTAIGNVESRESNVESRKILRNGQLLIERDGKTYNTLGAQVK